MRSYPFSAIVGSDDLGLALILAAVAPEIGGVLVRGEKGTAKTTMVRGLAAVLPPLRVVDGCRFGCDPLDPDPECPDGPHLGASGSVRPARLVELPVGATEDRVIGSLDLEQALGSGRVTYQPGLLAAAHRGILYVDEVNLLHDHLVDLLLDAVAMGRSTVEREGVSVAHASRLVLIGTMNPEEGELRPQLLDRFGLTVEARAPRDPGVRAEIIRRRMAYEQDPDGFAGEYDTCEEELSHRILSARSLLPSVKLGQAQLITIARVCAGFEVDGMRADIVTARAARAHAAWHGRDRVGKTDLRAAARLALPHRRRRNPFDAPGLDEYLLDRLLDDEAPEPDPEPDPSTRSGHDPNADPSTRSGHDPEPDPSTRSGHDPNADPSTRSGHDPNADPSTRSGHDPNSDPSTRSGHDPRSGPGVVARAGQTYRIRRFVAPGVGVGEAGRRSRALTPIGRVIAAGPGRGQGGLHLPATVRAAAPHQAARGRGGDSALRFAGPDLRRAVTEGRESNLVLLAVDASGSMSARRRMEAAKTAALSLLLDAYQRRDKVGLVTFRGASATLALPPTSSVETAARRLDELPAGGRTPLAEGLHCAAETLRRERIKDPRRRPLLVLVTDGRATAGPDAVARSRLAADLLRRTGVACVVVDCETGRYALGLAAVLCAHLAGQYVRVAEVAADTILSAVARSRAA
jgi:magnesium chelatase subunit D